MASQPPRRRPMGTFEKAEALFKAATEKPADAAPKAPAVPGVKENVSLRLDRDVLDHFQEDGRAGRSGSTLSAPGRRPRSVSLY